MLEIVALNHFFLFAQVTERGDSPPIVHHDEVLCRDMTLSHTSARSPCTRVTQGIATFCFLGFLSEAPLNQAVVWLAMKLRGLYRRCARAYVDPVERVSRLSRVSEGPYGDDPSSEEDREAVEAELENELISNSGLLDDLQNTSGGAFLGGLVEEGAESGGGGVAHQFSSATAAATDDTPRRPSHPMLGIGSTM